MADVTDILELCAASISGLTQNREATCTLETLALLLKTLYNNTRTKLASVINHHESLKLVKDLKGVYMSPIIVRI
jgi:hypothetical protein